MTQDQAAAAPAPSTSMALAVINRLTGEIVEDIRSADSETLARFVVDARTAVEEVGVACDLVSQELIGRLDKGLSWTERVGAPQAKVQYKISAPTPQAGTIIYPEMRLERELRALVERDVITEAGAARALKRKLKVEFVVPLAADLETLAARARESLTVELDGHTLRVEKAEATQSTVDAGIRALAKLEGTAAALARAREKRGTPTRKVKVEVIGRER